MDRKTRKCPRCGGRGLTGHGVAHLGIPGLCYACDGSGVQMYCDAAEMAAKAVAVSQAFQKELEEKAAYVKARMEKTRREVLKAQLADELGRLRHAWREAQAVIASGGCDAKPVWVPARKTKKENS